MVAWFDCEIENKISSFDSSGKALPVYMVDPELGGDLPQETSVGQQEQVDSAAVFNEIGNLASLPAGYGASNGWPSLADHSTTTTDDAGRKRRRRRAQIIVNSYLAHVRAVRSFVINNNLAAMELARSYLDKDQATSHNSFLHDLLSPTFSPMVFKQHLRLSPPRFLELWALVEQAPSYHRPRKSHTDPRVWFAATIYHLGHGSTCREVAAVFGISKSSFCEYRPMMLECITEVLSMHPDSRMGWPTSAEGWLALTETFVPSIFARVAAFTGVVAAGDGTCIPYTPSGLTELQKTVWICRKGYMAQNALVFFDGNQRIIAADLMHEGSSSDCELLKTYMTAHLNTIMPQGTYILFDSGEGLICVSVLWKQSAANLFFRWHP